MTGAVPSGRSVSARSLRSWNEYISLRRRPTSRPRCARRARCPRRPASRSGGSPPARTSRSAASITCWRSPTRGGSQSRVPRGCSIPLAHRSSARNGFVARSRPIVVAGPWPGKTRVSGGSVSTSMRRVLELGRIRALESVRPTLPAKSTSPLSSTPSTSRRRAPASAREPPAPARERPDLELLAALEQASARTVASGPGRRLR